MITLNSIQIANKETAGVPTPVVVPWDNLDEAARMQAWSNVRTGANFEEIVMPWNDVSDKLGKMHIYLGFLDATKETIVSLKAMRDPREKTGSGKISLVATYSNNKDDDRRIEEFGERDLFEWLLAYKPETKPAAVN